jgi:predicted DNA-binding ribbon-helix-helix protein
MNTAITKRSVLIMGRKTSISLEDMFWLGLKDIAAEQRISAATLLTEIDRNRGSTNFSSAVRQFVMGHYINLVSELRKGPTAPLSPRALESRAVDVTRSALPSTLS